MADSKKKFNITRIVSIVLSIITGIIILISMLFMRCESRPDASFFGYRLCAVHDESNTTLHKGDLAIIRIGINYSNASQVEVKTGRSTYVSTAAYAKDEIIGTCVAVIGGLGNILTFISDTPIIGTLIIVLFTALCILAATSSVAKNKVQKQSRLRTSVQFMFFSITNSFMAGFAKGTIYQGKLKAVCVPGLNCYSCPGAYGACPMGSLQAMFTKRSYSSGITRTAARLPFYVLGIIMLFGVVLGRFVCGFLCPFGLVQDLLHKIPLPRKLKIRTFIGDKQLRYVKYVILIVFVIILPIFTVQAFPWFCKLICPSGMLIGGIPLMSANEALRGAAGVFTVIKLSVLAFIILLSLMIYRPFCKYICPLGAIYGLLNKASFYKYKYDEKLCTHCGACVRICEMGVDITKNLTDTECIRCGKCVSVCPTNALKLPFSREKTKSDKEKGEVKVSS